MVKNWSWAKRAASEVVQCVPRCLGPAPSCYIAEDGPGLLPQSSLTEQKQGWPGPEHKHWIFVLCQDQHLPMMESLLWVSAASGAQEGLGQSQKPISAMAPKVLGHLWGSSRGGAPCSARRLGDPARRAVPSSGVRASQGLREEVTLGNTCFLGWGLGTHYQRGWNCLCKWELPFADLHSPASDF